MKNKQSITISKQALNDNLEEILYDVLELEYNTTIPNKSDKFNCIKAKLHNLQQHVNYIHKLQSK